MSDSTYSKLIEQLDNLGAPPGETIAGRIGGLYLALTEEKMRAVAEERGTGDAAWAALNAADLYVAEGTLATGIEGLARRRDDALNAATVFERKLESTLAALAAERERCLSATIANGEMLAELTQLRAENARLEAQRDVLAEQIQAAIRASAAPLERMGRGA